MDNSAVKELEQKFEAYQQQTDEKFNQLLQLLDQAQSIREDIPQVLDTTSKSPVSSEVQQPKVEKKQTSKQSSRDWATVIGLWTKK